MAAAKKYLFGQNNKNKQQQRYKPYDTSQFLGKGEEKKKVDVYVYNPLATSKDDVEKTLRVYAQSTTTTTTRGNTAQQQQQSQSSNSNNENNNNNEDITSGHPWLNEICCVSNTRREKKSNGAKIWWQPFNAPTTKKRLIDSTNWENRESNIIEKMKLYPKYFKNVIGKCNWHKIPEGTNSIECSFDEKKNPELPFIFTLSFASRGETYFDMVVIPHGEEARKLKDPFCWCQTRANDVLYEHSGDESVELEYGNRQQGMDINLLQNLTINNHSHNRLGGNNNNDELYASGCVAFHGYSKKTLFQLACTEPSICIVDKKPNSDECDIWIYHLPIIEEYLEKTTVAFLARFDIDFDRKKIMWNFTKTPTFITDYFRVGDVKEYKSGVNNLYGKLQTASFVRRDDNNAATATSNDTTTTNTTTTTTAAAAFSSSPSSSSSTTTMTMEDIMMMNDELENNNSSISESNNNRKRRRIRKITKTKKETNRRKTSVVDGDSIKKMKMGDDDNNNDDDEEKKEESAAAASASASTAAAASDSSASTSTAVATEEKEDEEKKNNNNNSRPYLLMVQEPLLTTGGGGEWNANDLVNLISDCIEKEGNRDCKKYSFHTNIKKLIKDEEKKEYVYDGSYDDCRYSLPIAGGSFIAKGGLVQTCKPIEGGQDLVKEFTDDLRECEGAIVLASSNYSVADIPEVYFKLNACYIIVNNDKPEVMVEEEDNSNNDEKKKKKKNIPNKAALDELLNNTDTSMANIQQGPLSCIFGYFPHYDDSRCYFIRGYAGKRSDEIRFGTALQSITDLIGLASVTCFEETVKKPKKLRYYALSNGYSFIDDCGKRVFDVDLREAVRGENIYYQLEAAAEDWALATFNEPHIFNNNKFDEKESYKAMNNYLSCILAQMEVLFDAQVLREIFDIAKNNLKKISNSGSGGNGGGGGGGVGRQKPTRREVLEMLLREKKKEKKDETLLVSKNRINQLLNKADMDKDFDMYWFKDELNKDDGSSFFNGVQKSPDYFKIIDMVVSFNRKFKESSKDGIIVLPTEINIKKTFLSLLVVKSRECFSTKSSYGKRGLDVRKILQRDEIRGNVAFINNINKKSEGRNDDEFDSQLLERDAKRFGYLLFKVDCEKLKKTTIEASSLFPSEDNKKKKDDNDDDEQQQRGFNNDSFFLRVDPTGRFIHTEDDFVSSYLLSSKDDKEKPTDGYVFKYNNDYMIAIPILDKIIGIMEDDNGKITAYPWSVAEEGGAMDIARILLRQSMHNLIEICAPELKDENSLLQNRSSPLIGHLVMGLLTSAAHALIEFYERPTITTTTTAITTSSSSSSSLDTFTDESLFVNGIRGVFGLLISVMASGSDHQLNPSYQCLMYDVKRRLEEVGWWRKKKEKKGKEEEDDDDSAQLQNLITSVKFNFANGKYWLTQFMKMEPHVRLKGVDIKENVISNVILKLKRYCQTMLNTSEISKNILRLKREADGSLENKNLWQYHVVRPLVSSIIKERRENNNNNDEDEDISRSFELADDDDMANLFLEIPPRLALKVVNTNVDIFVPDGDGGNDDDEDKDDDEDVEEEDDNDDEKRFDSNINRIEREIMMQIEKNLHHNTGHRIKRKSKKSSEELIVREEKDDDDDDDLIPNILKFLEQYCELIKMYKVNIPRGSKFNQNIYHLAKLIGATEYRNDIVNQIIEMNCTGSDDDDEFDNHKHLMDISNVTNNNNKRNNNNSRPDKERIKKAWRHVKSIASDRSMRQTGIFCIFIRNVLINSLNNVVKEFLRHTADEIEECNEYLAHKRFGFFGDLENESNKKEGEEEEKEEEEEKSSRKRRRRNELIKATIDFRRDRAKLFKIFLLMRNPYYETSYIPPVITALALSTSLQNIIHIYIGFDEIIKHFSKLLGYDVVKQFKGENDKYRQEKNKTNQEYNNNNDHHRQKKLERKLKRKEEKKSRRTKAEVEELVEIESETVEAIKNDDDEKMIELRCSESIAQYLKGFIQEYVENFNHFKLKQAQVCEKKDENKRDVIKTLEKSRDEKIMQDAQVVMMNSWLRENYCKYESINWGKYSKLFCLVNE